MKIHHFPLCLVALGLQVANAQEMSKSSGDVLEPGNHPATAEYDSVFSAPPEQIDKKISWTKRFKGDARFNTPQDVVIEGMAKKEMSPASTTNMAFDAEGVIKKIDPLSQKIKIAHGPIESLGMPGMTMVFKVSEAQMLSVAEVGEKIGFNVSDSDAGFIVTALSRLNASPAAAAVAADGRGVVKSVRNGKVKLKHGPIEKFGMPGMTMMFKAKDPAMLEGLTPGVEVEFDVDNTDGGFIITRIKPAK